MRHFSSALGWMSTCDVYFLNFVWFSKLKKKKNPIGKLSEVPIKKRITSRPTRAFSLFSSVDLSRRLQRKGETAAGGTEKSRVGEGSGDVGSLLKEEESEGQSQLCLSFWSWLWSPQYPDPGIFFTLHPIQALQEGGSLLAESTWGSLCFSRAIERILCQSLTTSNFGKYMYAQT